MFPLLLVFLSITSDAAIENLQEIFRERFEKYRPVRLLFWQDARGEAEQVRGGPRAHMP
jgi:hypothetical protein